MQTTKSRRCSICHREVKGNGNPEKILTCGYCVLVLLAADQEYKQYLANNLRSQGKEEVARSVEAFITPVVDTTIATFKRTIVQRPSNRILRAFKHRQKSI